MERGRDWGGDEIVEIVRDRSQEVLERAKGSQGGFQKMSSTI